MRLSISCGHFSSSLPPGEARSIYEFAADPPGPAIVGQKISGETGLRILHLKLTFRMIEINLDYHRLRLDVNLPFGITVHEDLSCTPLDDTYCRADCPNFDFPRGWRGSLLRFLMKRELNTGPIVSQSRLKRAAELRQENGSRQ